ncbi:MAG: hypothetical protein DYG96_12200 [Chlorobi bacterium CHB2]|nr:hypothetical protein [Chlorobi bacterium CHB2]
MHAESATFNVWTALIFCLALLVSNAAAADFQGAGHALSYEGPPVNYQTGRLTDAISKIEERGVLKPLSTKG